MVSLKRLKKCEGTIRVKSDTRMKQEKQNMIYDVAYWVVWFMVGLIIYLITFKA